MAWLDYAADGVTHEHALGPVTTLGRHPASELQLLNRSVERRHATIVERRGVFLLTAHALVRVGGRACGVLAPVALLPGDIVEIGELALTFRLPVVTAHGAAPHELVGAPLGQPVPLVRVEGAACDLDDARRLGGAVVARGDGHLELLFPGAGVALEAALALSRAGRATGSTRIGADLAPLEAARAGAARAAAASDGHVVGTDAFAGRALMDATLSGRDVLLHRLPEDGEPPLLVIASD